MVVEERLSDDRSSREEGTVGEAFLPPSLVPLALLVEGTYSLATISPSVYLVGS